MKKGDIHILGDKRYIILTTIEYEEIEYAFANLVTDTLDNELEEYVILYQDNGILKSIEDTNLVNELIPIFRENIKALREECLK